LKPFEIIELIYNLDRDASIISQDQRLALKELAELKKKSEAGATLLNKARTEMSFHETEMCGLYKKIDDLENKKSVTMARLNAAKTDDEQRSYKREIEYVERNVREYQKKVDVEEDKIEQSKLTFQKAEDELAFTRTATEDELQKAESAQNSTKERLLEISTVRDSYLEQLDMRIAQHYLRVSKITRNVDGPIARIMNTACGNCRIDLSPLILNHLALGRQVDFCPHCSHILLPEA